VLEMLRLREFIDRFSRLVAEGTVTINSKRSDDGTDYLRLVFPEDQWPRMRPEAFTPVAFKTEAIEGEAPEKTLLRAILTSPENMVKLSKVIAGYYLHSWVKQLFREIRNDQEMYKNHLGMFDAFTQKGGHSVEVFFTRPECPAVRSGFFKTSKDSDHATVDARAEAGMYRRVAILAVPPEVAAADVADFAYKAFQAEGWRDNQNVIALADYPRTATAGDVFIIDSEPARWSEVALSSGFKKLERFWPSKVDADRPVRDHGCSGPSF
jgi:hypothetical protein